LEISTRNQGYVRTISQTQLELKELLKGKVESDLDESFRDKVLDMEKQI
jgi:hypothetical protein